MIEQDVIDVFHLVEVIFDGELATDQMLQLLLADQEDASILMSLVLMLS